MTDHPDKTEQAPMSEQADRAGGDGDGPCFYCGEPTVRYAGDPGLWPLYFCQPDGTGVTRIHHTRCVTSRLAAPPSGNAGERAEPVAWYVPDNSAAMTRDRKVAELWHKVGLTVRALYDAAPPKPAPDALREALTDARDAISRLPEDTFGFGNCNDESQWWPIRDELLAKISTALSSAPVPSGERLKQNADRAHDKLYGISVPSGEGSISEIIRGLRDEYPAVDVTTAVFADLAGIPCCVIPRERVLAIIDALVRVGGAL